MGTFTAQILVGQSHTYDSGIINISHTLYLSENSRPAWVLSPTDLFKHDKQPGQKQIIWIPTLEHMLEDALVMAGLYILKDEQLVAMADRFFKDPDKDFIELYDEIKPEHLQKMYQRARSIESSHKILLSVFQGSSLVSHLPVLENYQNDIEVCQSVYRKEFSAWSRQFEVRGELVPSP